MNKPKTSYQVMTSILTNYNPSLEEKKTVNSFFLCRYLSNNIMSVFVANAFNRYYNEIPVNVQYDMSKQILRGRIKWIQFPKKTKTDTTIIKSVCRFYKVSEDHAQEYIDMMNESEIKRFENMYEGA